MENKKGICLFTINLNPGAMKYVLITFCFTMAAIFSQAGNRTDTVPSDFNYKKSHYKKAKLELIEMLEGRTPLSYEKAIFITENAYWGNRGNYSTFQTLIGLHTKRIAQLFFSIYDSEGEPEPRLHETSEEINTRYIEANVNKAIYAYLTDTTVFTTQNGLNTHFPYQYSSTDPLGTRDWKNSQVTHLLSSHKGNCFALTSLFKIFSERFKSNAKIATAPGHIFIRHKGTNDATYNIELATRSFPGNGSIETLSYTTNEAVRNGISMRTLNKKQSVALCLVYLAKGYANQFGVKEDDFIQSCADLALKYDSLNLNAMLLKAELMEERIIKLMDEREINSVAQISNYPELQKEFKIYEQFIVKMYELGYREMPTEMKNLIIARLMNDNQGFFLKDHTPNPFKNIGVTDTRYATLSWGMFEESYETKPFEKYFRTIFNTSELKIERFENKDTLYNKYNIDPVVFAWSIDPLAHKYPSISPYAAFANNPIMFADRDGQVLWDPQAKKEVVFNSETNKFSYKDGSELSEAYRKQAMPTLQKLTSSDVGIKLVESMQSISTKIIIDETDRKAKRNAPIQANSVVVPGEVTDDGLYDEVQITPIWKNIEENAAIDKMDIEEKLLATMVVEFGHFSTADQIALEKSLGHRKIYSDPSAFAEVYNPLLNDAIRAEVAYRREQGQEIDESVFNPILRVQQSEVGKDVKLDKENQALYDQITE